MILLLVLYTSVSPAYEYLKMNKNCTDNKVYHEQLPKYWAFIISFSPRNIIYTKYIFIYTGIYIYISIGELASVTLSFAPFQMLDVYKHAKRKHLDYYSSEMLTGVMKGRSVHTPPANRYTCKVISSTHPPYTLTR